MESVRRRRCETCAFHQQGPTPCTGFCRNLDWQPQGGAIRFVRDRELACYGGWGIDFWRSRNENGTDSETGGPGMGSGGHGASTTSLTYTGTRAGGATSDANPVDRLLHLYLSDSARANAPANTHDDVDHLSGRDDWN